MTEDLDIPDEIVITPWDSVAQITSDEFAVEYITAILELNDPGLLPHALSDVAKARGITKVARDAGITLEDIHRALEGGAEAELGRVFWAMSALGIKLVAARADQVVEG